MKKFLILLVLITSFFNLSIALSAPAEELLDSVVAVVNKEVITETQLKKEIAEIEMMYQYQRLRDPNANVKIPPLGQLREKALQSLIDRSLARQFAKRAKIEITAEQIDATIDDLAAKNNMDRETFIQALQNDGITLNQYRDKLRNQLLDRDVKQKVIAAKIKIEDKEIQEAMSEPNNPLLSKQIYLVQDYLVEVPDGASEATRNKAKQKAEKIKTLLSKQGAISATDARYVDLGWRLLHEMPSVFADKVTEMDKNEISTPFLTNNGYHVLHLVDIKPAYDGHMSHEYRLRHLLMKPTALLTDNLVQQQLHKIREEIQKGTPFAKLARKYSEDFDSAADGGDMGWLRVQDLPPFFVENIRGLQTGQVSVPFKSPAGWHLLFVEDSRVVDDSQAMREEDVKQWLFHKKLQEETKKWYKEMRKTSFIKIEKVIT